MGENAGNKGKPDAKEKREQCAKGCRLCAQLFAHGNSSSNQGARWQRQPSLRRPALRFSRSWRWQKNPQGALAEFRFRQRTGAHGSWKGAFWRSRGAADHWGKVGGPIRTTKVIPGSFGLADSSAVSRKLARHAH